MAAVVVVVVVTSIVIIIITPLWATTLHVYCAFITPLTSMLQGKLS